MSKKILFSLFIIISLVFSYTVVFAADGALNNAADSVRNVVGGAENAMENAARNISGASKDATNNIENAGNNIRILSYFINIKTVKMKGYD